MLHIKTTIQKLLAIYCMLMLVTSAVAITTYAGAWNRTYKEVEYTLQIGDWLTEEWQEDTFYSQGDVVFFEGNYYIAIRRFVPWNIEPTGHPASWVFWEIE